MKRPLLVSLLLAAAACSTDHTGPGMGQPGVDVGVSTQRSSSASTALAVTSGPDATVIATLTDTVTVRGVALVLRRLKLKPVRTAACESDDDEGDRHERAGDDGRAESDDAGCEEIKAGPVLVSLPLGTTAVSALVSVTAPPGQYDRVQFTIHAPRQPHDSAFLRVNPGFAGVSVQVTGTFSHKGAHSDFTYTAALEAQQQVDLSPPITVDATNTAGITLRFDISTWFAKRDCATLLDPATGNDGGRNERLIRDNISQSIDAFEDERRDGHDHHDRRDGHGGHERCVGPTIVLSRDSLGFGAAQGGANPAAQTVGITNGGGLTLSGLATAITYGSGQGWLTATLSSTNAPSTLTLTAAPGSLAAGTYAATVDVTSPDASNNPQPVTATLVVAPQVLSGLTVTFPKLTPVNGSLSVPAGTFTDLTVAATDASGKVVTGYRGIAIFTSSDSQATLPLGYPFSAADAGTHTFVNGVRMMTSGVQMVTATDDITHSITGHATVTVVAVPFASLTAGNSHTCALTATGAAYCWGNNYYGQLGNGTTTQRLTPWAVAGGLTFASLDAGGSSHVCGLTSAGAAYCWGDNGYGQLGDGSIGNTRNAPVAVGRSPGFASLTVGGYEHTCGLTSAGAAYCWGDNGYGELGTGTPGTHDVFPVAVAGGLTFASVTAGLYHTCGLTSAGAAYCWGRNNAGQVGDGTLIDRASPVAVAGGLTFASLKAGGVVTCGLTAAGAAYCWGDDSKGEVGDGTTTLSRSTPVAVMGGLTFAKLTVGGIHACGLTSAGAAYCWGFNFYGQLGDGTTTDRSSPVAVAGGVSFASLTGGYYHTCGLTSASVAYCWGDDGNGQLGDGTTTSRSSPTPVVHP